MRLMMPRYILLSFLLLGLVSCGKEHGNAEISAAAAAPAADASKMLGYAGVTESSADKSVPVNAEVKRYIALRHSLTVETSPKQMQAAFDATVARCAQLNCQTLSANYNRETPYSPPSASLSVRVPPKSLETLLSGLEKNGEVTQHHQESEDKTDAVIDAEARIKNLTQFRDSLRAMLSDKSAKFKDLIEVQRQLVDTQSELDTIQGVRKVLAQETELVAVTIDFTAAQGITEQGFFAPVAQAITNAGHVMMESIATVITFFVTILPWLLFGIPALILVRKLWLKVKSKWLMR